MPHAQPPSPDRTAEWLASVADPALRELDEQLLMDLLVIERRGPGVDVAADLAREYLRTAAAADSARFRRRCAERGITVPAADKETRSRGRRRRPAVRQPPPRVAGDLARRYAAAAADAKAVWDAADKNGVPDLAIARGLIADLSAAVCEETAAIVAISTSSDEGDYTFTHMVNVAILTMAQAHALGIGGPRQEEIGLAALLHDIGKVRTPTAILEKPERLTGGEFQVMMRHTIDGAEMLRGVSGMPMLPPVVAFEHHLRLDGSGYPDGVRRERLNVATMMCSIADVFDAMRSQRTYQPSYSRERILSVLNRGRQFDPELVRRFIALIDVPPSTQRMVAP
jgi:putative nucleotidyltransferase with HDIG domain